MAMVRKMYDRHGNHISQEDVWRRWRTVELAVVDEIGERQTPTDHHRQVLRRTYDERENRPIVFVSNKAPLDLLAAYTEPLCGRWTSGTVFHVQEKYLKAAAAQRLLFSQTEGARK